ncbi:hypothetical protein QZH41_013623, partial [Actinostola sp. cb2023]
MDIPFKDRPPNLPDNRPLAEHRLRLLGNRLQKNPELSGRYTASMHELLDRGYAEAVTDENLKGRDGYTWYLPHHPVLHPRKPDKCRLVYDCAAKYRGVSLNDKVHQGPDLTNGLVGVLLRFRQEPIALMADIEGMFHQVRVSEGDRDALRFLWWRNDDPNETPMTYRMTAHLFGGVWSPSCANFAIKRCAKDNAENFDPNTISTVIRNFYVDDCLKSVASPEEAVRLVQELRQLLSNGGFHLTKWVSNSREVLRSVPECEWAKGVKTLNLDRELLPAERTLGVLWRVESDTYGFDVHLEEKPLTRRGLLSTVCSVYDPLGFVSPFVLRAKILFQELCRNKCGWDNPMPSEVKDQWSRWLQDVPLIQNLDVPRCLKPEGFEVESAELHHFADASEHGYGAVSYLRLVDTTGAPHCSFLMSKSRLAPLKSTTIPRLELAAAVEAVKLDKLLCKELQMSLQTSTGIINGRPITRISDDPKDLTPLTPNHLLLLRSGPTLPSGLFVKQDIYRRRWRQVQYMADIFWKRWRSEYLPTLQERQKWLCPKRNFQVGDLVLVKHDNSPRPRWPLGLIVDTYPGSDGLVRSVQVKTQSGVYVRPVDKI